MASSNSESSFGSQLSNVETVLQHRAAQARAFNRSFEAENHLPGSFRSSQITRTLAYTRQKIDPTAHAQREVHKASDEILISGWRKHFTHRLAADKATTQQEKLESLGKALESLQEISDGNCTLRGVLLAHSKALVHYEMGVLERDIAFSQLNDSDDSPDDRLIDKALGHFEQAQKAYEPFLAQVDGKLPAVSRPDSKKRAQTEQTPASQSFQHPDLINTLGPIMGTFNDNSPFHTLANVLFNKACLNEEFKQTSSQALTHELAYALELCRSGEEHLKNAKLVQTPMAQTNASQTKRSIQLFLRALGDRPEPSDSSSSNAKKQKLFHQRGDVSLNLQPQERLRESVRSVASIYQSNKDAFLRSHQVEQLNHLLKTLSSDQSNVKVVCQMPTGTGKTAVMAALIALVNQSASEDQGDGTQVRPNIIIAVPSLTLVNQTKQKLLEYGQVYSDRFAPLTNLKEQIGVWSGEQKEIRPITVTTYNSLSRFLGRLEGTEFPKSAAWDQCDRYFHPENDNVMLVFDEAHRCNGKGLNRFLTQDQANRLVVGFSGSADQYADTLPLTVLPPLSITDAIEQKAITPVEFLDLQFTHHPKVQEMKKRIGIRPNQELSHEQKEALDDFLIASSGITLSAARTIQKLFVEKDPTTKIMVFCNTSLHTRNTAEIFNSIGVGAVFTYGNLSKADQEKALQRFENDPSVHVMVSCGQLDEGYDFPRERSPKGVSVVLDFVPHMNKGRLIQQRLGRATRLASDNSEKLATFIRVKLIAGEGQKQSWDLLAADGSKRFHGASTSALTESEPFELKPLRLRTAASTPQNVRSVIGADSAVLEPYGARLRFAHPQNRSIKLGEGVPDNDPADLVEQPVHPVASINIDPIPYAALRQAENYSPLDMGDEGGVPDFSADEYQDFLQTFGL